MFESKAGVLFVGGIGFFVFAFVSNALVPIFMYQDIEEQHVLEYVNAGKDDVLVGRIRKDPTAKNCINLWLVSDNLRKGAALNAVQIAEELISDLS